MEPDLIPTLDPNPLPAPYWVFKLLLIVTFFLHIVAMNLVLGGGILALVLEVAFHESGDRQPTVYRPCQKAARFPAGHHHAWASRRCFSSRFFTGSSFTLHPS